MFSVMLVYFLGSSVHFVNVPSLEECFKSGTTLVQQGKIDSFQCAKLGDKNETVFV